MPTHQRQPYFGTERKLVIAIDVGTTFSGVSYVLLDPGAVPQIQPVTQFVGQREPRGDSKVPSIVCYSQDGTVVAAGAETDPETNDALAEMDDVIRVEWFKLHLRPPHLAPSQEFELQKLRSFPKNKTPVQVFGDFLRYLFHSTKKYIVDSELWSWDSVERNTYFVLSHPNGWEGKQQSQMRKAAIAADLVDKSEASERISFISEGEASLHFCLNKNPNLHNERDGILVVDCGGGTIDVSAYSQTIKRRFKEIMPPECLFQGSIFITCRAKEYLRQRLRNSKYGSDDEIEAIATAFDKINKCTFNSPNTPCYVKFGGLKYNDPKFDIRSGSIKIAGTQIASLFEPALQVIIQLINRQRSMSTVTIKTVLLVGGFARSEYLFSQLKSHFTRGVSITRPDITHLNKAVADGAASYYLDHYVTARVSKYSYGLMINTIFDPTNPEHAHRRNTRFMDADGKYKIPGGFDTILKKGTTVNEETEFRQSYTVHLTPKEFTRWTEDCTFLKCYQGEAESPPEWIDLEPNSFHDTCVIKADVTNVKENMNSKYEPPTQKRYYRFGHDVKMLFGLTELKAYVTWKENVRSRNLFRERWWLTWHQGVEKQCVF
ncbi:hypothetical protein M378DRAFT_83572 [Amanita muscaria Koide BX008]|uniref:Uncharacterized protein n=1 Tax=Amanita muscaria (strain Koide BX008) TaxID=946122 RepID=A0A0C2WGN0_AMAMK|nr:hypothetical protein M378DRAFT_83572 [Amanita muscaria Koide BX008]